MGDDFFRLEGDYDTLNSEEELTNHLRRSTDLRNVLFFPETLAPHTRNEDNPFVGKTFTNVSFSHTRISGVIFRNCKFVKCLFIGTRFVDCEFHSCSFEGCNPYRVEFKNTYIDPRVFEGMLDPVKYSNIGMYLFQNLYENSTERNQLEFVRSAEFNRYKWSRYVLNYRYAERSKWDFLLHL